MQKKDENLDYQLVIFGATPAGIVCAVRAAREGLSVLLVNRSQQIGGLLSNGLSVMDTLYAGARSPLYDELRRSIHDYYRLRFGPDSPQFAASRPGHPKTYYEAHVVEQLLKEMVARETGITLRLGFQPIDIVKANTLITSVVFEEPKSRVQFMAKSTVFADCSYEADFAVMAGVEYRAGREAKSEFGEEYAGRIFMKRFPSWPPVGVDPRIIEDYKKLNLFHYDRWFEILKEESTGESDKAVQAFNIRAVLTDNPDNRNIPTTPPATYDPAIMAKIWSEKPQYSQLLGPLPNNKYLWNMPELLGPQIDYPDGDWEKREAIIEAHRQATRGMLYYLQNDPAVDKETQKFWRNLGFARDEFPNNGNLPYEVYARETRRIKGRKVYTERDARLAEGFGRTPVHDDSISVTEWFLDVHPCNHEKKGESLYEGEIYLNYVSHPGQISYKTLLPEKIDNLFVPVCLSCTHVGWGAIRLEPTWMSIAEAVAHATVLSLENNVTPARVDSDELLRRLATHRIMISFFNDVPLEDGESWMPAVQYFGAKGFFDSYYAKPYELLTKSLAGYWISSTLDDLSGKEVDKNARATAIAKFSKDDDSRVTAKEFVDSLTHALDTSGVSLSPETIRQWIGPGSPARLSTRAKACELLFMIK